MSAQDLINAWGRKKYPNHSQAVFTFEVRDTSGCPTCGPCIECEIYADNRHVDSRDASIAELLAEILETPQ